MPEEGRLSPEERQKVIRNFVLIAILFGLGYAALYAAGIEYIATLVVITSIIFLLAFVIWRCRVIANRPYQASQHIIPFNVFKHPSRVGLPTWDSTKTLHFSQKNDVY
jgi:hypothetical protein